MTEPWHIHSVPAVRPDPPAAPQGQPTSPPHAVHPTPSQAPAPPGQTAPPHPPHNHPGAQPADGANPDQRPYPDPGQPWPGQGLGAAPGYPGSVPGYPGPEAQQAGIWPPRPAFQQVSSYAPYYTSTRGVAIVAITVLTCLTIIEAVETAFYVTHNAPSSDTFAILDTVKPFFEAMVYAIWAYCAYRNLQALRVQGLSMGPWSAFFYFFIPFISIFKPYFVLAEIFRATDPDVDRMANPVTWKQFPTSRMVALWWFFQLTSAIVYSIAAAVQITGLPDVQALISLPDMSQWFAASHILKIGQDVLGIAAVNMLANRQDARGRSTGLLRPDA
jgi:hypothetical protein